MSVKSIQDVNSSWENIKSEAQKMRPAKDVHPSQKNMATSSKVTGLFRSMTTTLSTPFAKASATIFKNVIASTLSKTEKLVAELEIKKDNKALSQTELEESKKMLQSMRAAKSSLSSLQTQKGSAFSGGLLVKQTKKADELAQRLEALQAAAQGTTTTIDQPKIQTKEFHLDARRYMTLMDAEGNTTQGRGPLKANTSFAIEGRQWAPGNIPAGNAADVNQVNPRVAKFEADIHAKWPEAAESILKHTNQSLLTCVSFANAISPQGLSLGKTQQERFNIHQEGDTIVITGSVIQNPKTAEGKETDTFYVTQVKLTLDKNSGEVLGHQEWYSPKMTQVQAQNHFRGIA